MPQRQPNHHHTLTPETFINDSCFLFPVSNNEVFNTIMSLSNSQSIGSDGLHPDIIKSNALFISSQLTYIFNLSFTQGIFQDFLKLPKLLPYIKAAPVLILVTIDQFQY